MDMILIKMNEIQAYLEEESKIDDFEKLKEEHDGVILGFLNNRRSNPKDVHHYMFVNGKQSLIDNPRIQSRIKLIPNHLIGELTTCQSSDQSDHQLVVFLPIIYQIYQSGSRRQILQYMLRYFQNPDYLGQIDQAFDDLIKMEETFWGSHFFDPSEKNPYNQHDQTWFIGKRIKNRMCENKCEDSDLIRRIDDTEFKRNFLTTDYDWLDILEPLDKVYERMTTFQEWKRSLQIEPLPIEDYQKCLSYQETEKLFQGALDYDPEYFTKLYGIFLSSYHLCQLVIHHHSSWMMIEYMKRSEPQEKRIIFTKMSKILYLEERLLSGMITINHRSILPLNFCSALGIYSLNTLPPVDCFFPFNIDPEVINFNFPGKITVEGEGKIRHHQQFISCFQQISEGILEGLDWKGLNVYFTGATAELCYYNNTVFPFEYLISNGPNNPYLGSDIDLGVRIDPQELGIETLENLNENQILKDELRHRAEMILLVVKKNTGFDNLKLRARNNRWIISDSRLPREIDIFSFVQDPAALIYNYHMATCRVIAQLDDQPEIRMTTSSCLSALLGTCIDRRWFTSKTSIHQRMMKQFKRGIGVILNPHETKVMIQYFKIYRERNKKEPTDILYDLRHHDYYYNNLRRHIGVDLFANNNEIYGRFRSEF